VNINGANIKKMISNRIKSLTKGEID